MYVLLLIVVFTRAQEQIWSISVLFDKGFEIQLSVLVSPILGIWRYLSLLSLAKYHWALLRYHTDSSMDVLKAFLVDFSFKNAISITGDFIEFVNAVPLCEHFDHLWPCEIEQIPFNEVRDLASIKPILCTDPKSLELTVDI